MSETNRQKFGSVDGWIDGWIAGWIACKQMEGGMEDEFFWEELSTVLTYALVIPLFCIQLAPGIACLFMKFPAFCIRSSTAGIKGVYTYTPHKLLLPIR